MKRYKVLVVGVGELRSGEIRRSRVRFLPPGPNIILTILTFVIQKIKK